MSFKEWKYRRIKRRIEKDKKLLGYIGNRIQRNIKKSRDMENSGSMMVIEE